MYLLIELQNIRNKQAKRMPELEIDKSTIKLRDLNFSLSITEEYIDRKLSKNGEYFNIINGFDLDIYKTNYCRVDILFKCYVTFTKLDHVRGHKTYQ